MTSSSLAGAVTLRERAHPEALLDVSLRVIRVFRPSDGWLAVGLLVLNLLVVVLSVEQANWVPTPDLKLLILLGMAAGLFSLVCRYGAYLCSRWEWLWACLPLCGSSLPSRPKAWVWEVPTSYGPGSTFG